MLRTLAAPDTQHFLTYILLPPVRAVFRLGVERRCQCPNSLAADIVVGRGRDRCEDGVKWKRELCAFGPPAEDASASWGQSGGRLFRCSLRLPFPLWRTSHAQKIHRLVIHSASCYTLWMEWGGASHAWTRPTKGKTTLRVGAGCCACAALPVPQREFYGPSVCKSVRMHEAG